MSRLSLSDVMCDGCLKAYVQMRREPPARPEYAKETHEGRRPKGTCADVALEERLAPEEARDIAMMFNRLWPVV